MPLTAREEQLAIALYKNAQRADRAEERVRAFEQTVREVGENLADGEIARGRLNSDERYDFVRQFEQEPVKVVTELRDLQADEDERRADAERIGIDPKAMI